MSKGKKSKKGKADKKGKKTQGRFRLLDLPEDLIEEIAKRLQYQKRLKTLANLNAGNKYLHEVTSRFLWESVRWNKTSWEAFLAGMSSRSELPGAFSHVQFIALLEADDNFGTHAGPFWASLMNIPHSKDATFGQIAHTFFPKLKCAIRYTARGRNAAVRNYPSIYISDQNVIERNDVAVLREVIIEIMDEYREARITHGPSDLQFQLDRLNCLDFEGRCLQSAAMLDHNNNKRTSVDSGEAERVQFRLMSEYLPYRKIAIVTLDANCSLRINLLTKDPIGDMRKKIKQKVLHIFHLVRGAAKNDLGTKWTLKMVVDRLEEYKPK